MKPFYLSVVIALLLTLFAGLLRIWIGPSETDRMMVAQLFGSTGVATLLVLAQALDRPAVHDVALVFALLSVVATVTFVRRLRQASSGP